MDYIASTLFILFYFHFIIHKTSISYCLYYNTAKFVSVFGIRVCVCESPCVHFQFGVFIDFAVCCSLFVAFDFPYCKERYCGMNEIPFRMCERANDPNWAAGGMKEKGSRASELTGFYDFSFWQYADEIWCMLTYLDAWSMAKIKMPLLAFNLQNNKMPKK